MRNHDQAVKWHSTICTSSDGVEPVVVEVRLQPDSPWFSGHFEGDPVLPGIAQLKMVSDAVRAFGNVSGRITGVRKVRFKQMIRPEEPLTITVKRQRDAPETYSFRVTVKEKLACSGLMTTKVL